MRLFDELVSVSGTPFTIFRNGQRIKTVKGLYQNEYSADLPYDCGIKAGDVVFNEITEERFIAKNIKKELSVTGDCIDFVSVEGEEATEHDSTKIVYNVGNAYGSAFGPNSSSVYQCASIDDLRKLASVHNADEQKINELLEVLEKCVTNDSCHKGVLSKFSSFLQENSWLSGPVATLLLNHLLG